MSCQSLTLRVPDAEVSLTSVYTILVLIGVAKQPALQSDWSCRKLRPIELVELTSVEMK